MINILTDSCSDLTPDLKKQHNIYSIPLSVYVNDRVYKDGVDITPPELFQFVEESGRLPKTSAPSLAEFTQLYQSAPGELIFIGISSKLSATVQHATAAAQSLPDRSIRVVDSLNLSTGIGLLVLKAADLRSQGMSSEEIAKTLGCAVEKVRTSFVIDTLEYLYLGGRCSAMQNIFGSLLKIRPVIEVRKDGTLGVKEKIRGSRKHTLNTILEDFRNNLERIDLQRVFITHTGCKEDAQYLRSELSTMAPIQEILITTAGATIASHCGPNTIGVLYSLQ